MAALGVRTEKLRLYGHVVNGVLLIMFVLACTIRVVGKKLYEFLAVTKVDGLPPAPSFDASLRASNLTIRVLDLASVAHAPASALHARLTGSLTRPQARFPHA